MKKKLLVIEDESAVAKQLRRGLNKEYHVSIACDVTEAERWLKTDSFPVATLDLGLPPFPDNPSQGLSLLERMHELMIELEDLEARAQEVLARIEAVEDVAQALFDEWEEELDQCHRQRPGRSAPGNSERPRGTTISS